MPHSVFPTPSACQCVNELDSEAPPPFEYRPHRRCGPGVELSHTKDFLLSCSCDGGCCAKEGCQCHKLSLEEAHRTRVHDLMHPLQAAEVSYTHRRLLTERTAAYVVGHTRAHVEYALVDLVDSMHARRRCLLLMCRTLLHHPHYTRMHIRTTIIELTVYVQNLIVNFCMPCVSLKQ